MLFVSILLPYQLPIYFIDFLIFTNFAIFTKWLQTDQWTEKTKDRWTNGKTYPFIEIRWTHIKMTNFAIFTKALQIDGQKHYRLMVQEMNKWMEQRTNTLVEKRKAHLRGI